MEIINYPRLTSSPISPETPNEENVKGLPSPNLTEPNQSSPKNDDITTKDSKSSSNSSVTTAGSSFSKSNNMKSPILSAMLRSLSASASPNSNFSSGNCNSKELNITEYSNKELKSMKKRCRTVMTQGQSRILRKVLEQTAFPSTEIRESLAKLLGMKPRTVQIWFQNQRQKSRQGRSNSLDDLQSINDGSPNSSCSSSSGSEDCGDETIICSSPFESSPVSMASTSSSPGFTALTAAAFALSNSPIEQSSVQVDTNQNQQQRYSTFHGAVYKSVPGCIPVNIPSSNHYRGNTASAIHAKRAVSSQVQSQGIMYSNGNFVTNMPPNQPQNIPTYNPQYPRNSNNEAIPLDVLASAVSKFRPNGYNYFMKQSAPQGQWHGPQLPTQAPSLHNRNRLAPLRTTSPPVDSSEISNITSMKLPSLKDLAQVASIGMTELEKFQIQQRSKSFSADNQKEPVQISAPRRFSSIELSSNYVAPNSPASARRPW